MKKYIMFSSNIFRLGFVFLPEFGYIFSIICLNYLLIYIYIYFKWTKAHLVVSKERDLYKTILSLEHCKLTQILTITDVIDKLWEFIFLWWILWRISTENHSWRKYTELWRNLIRHLPFFEVHCFPFLLSLDLGA